VREKQAVRVLESGRYELLRTPLVARDLAVGDEFEVDAGTGRYTVVRRAAI
jgi:hypothetical protein